MTASSFDAQIVNGQLVPAEPLRPFEGRQVHVVVSVRALPVEEATEPPEDMDVEKDVYVRLPLLSKAIGNPIIANEAKLKPCLILPEDLPDD